MDFLCDICGKSFTTKSNLTRHHKATHEKTSDANKCDVCGQNFSRKDVLLRHKKSEHGIERVVSDEHKPFACSLCDKKYTARRNLVAHTKKEHGGAGAAPPEVADGDGDALDENEAAGEGVSKPSVPCLYPGCKNTYSRTGNLNKHLKNDHPEYYELVSKISCPMCEELKFSRHSTLAEHLVKVHDYDNACETQNFATMDAFSDWKYKLEKDTKSSYVKPGGSFPVKEGQRQHYVCHRSGVFTSKAKKTDRYYRLQTRKCGFVCPARMSVTEHADGSITVVWYKNHFNHDSCIRFLNLTARERGDIRKKVEMGLTARAILDQYRQSDIDLLQDDRINVLKMRDIWNIARGYIGGLARAHQNDYLSVASIVESFSNKPNNPFIFCKLQDMPCNCGEGSCPLQFQDFMIIIMTPYQKNVLLKYPQGGKILIDSTHGTNGYKFDLTTLMSVDECGAGVPLCYCLSNTVDTDFMCKFFREVLKVAGLLKPTVFMSDMAGEFYKAWVQVMGEVQHRLYCSWHVKKCWRKNIREKIRDVEKQVDVLKRLTVLKNILKETVFTFCLESQMEKWEADEDLQAFVKYFKDHYHHNVKQWALCHRVALGLNVNMYLEALHKKLKHSYMAGKVQRRVDECLSHLMRYTRDIAHERLARAVFGNDSSRQAKIVASHKKSVEEFTAAMVTQESRSDGSVYWLVKSANATYVNRFYTVEENKDEECLGCPLACLRCYCCVHSFKCTCEDHSIRKNVCKHIHAMVRFSGQDSGCDFSSEVLARRIDDEMENMRELVEDTPNLAVSVEIEDTWKTLSSTLQHYMKNCTATKSLVEKGAEFLQYMMTHTGHASEPELAGVDSGLGSEHATVEVVGRLAPPIQEDELAENIDDPALPTPLTVAGSPLKQQTACGTPGSHAGTPLRLQACTTPRSSMINGSPLTPHNERVTPQRRGFHSTKRPTQRAKRSLNNLYENPDEYEQAEIVKQLVLNRQQP